MKKKIALLLALLVAMMSFAGCNTKQESDKIVLKICTLENEEHGQGVLLATFKEKVEELSNGQIEVQTYYNGSLYTQDGAIPALRSGELEMNLTSLQTTAEYLPSIAMLASTFMFKDYEHMRSVMDSEIGDNLKNQIKETAGYIPLGWYYNGSRQLNLDKEEPVMSPEDMKGVVLRMPSSAAWLAAGESLGASVSPLAYGEVYTALQTGTIDAQDNPMPAVKTAKFYEVTNQLCLTYHIIDFGLIALNANVWDSMNEQQQGWVTEAAEAAAKACDEVILKNEAELIDFFKSEGLNIVYPDVNAFSEYAHNYYVEKNLTADWDMELYNKIQEMAE